jgi:NAD(P)H-hydrate epimerase
VQILNAEQVRAWDQFTIANEPVSSIDLMERAAVKCSDWILSKNWKQKPFRIFCGKGNNGGDGLAIARHLIHQSLPVSVYILEFGKKGAEDFQQNLQRLHDLHFTDIHFIQSAEHFPSISSNDIVIDALLGSGLNKPLEGLAAELVKHINHAEALVVAIDLPSGLYIDKSSLGNPVIKATFTLTFQCYKLGLLVQDNAEYIGKVELLDICLHPAYLEDKDFGMQTIDKALAKKIYRPRSVFAHKGKFGHALLVAGSYGKMGAAVLAAKACIRAGAGLTTAFIPKNGYEIMQVAVPEAMVLTGDSDDHISTLPDDIEKYSSIGIGPGLGTSDETRKIISFIVRRYENPIIIDADGLNCLAMEKQLLAGLPDRSVLTPHLKEFERLFGSLRDDFERIRMAQEKAKELTLIIVLKSHHTLIALPDGQLYFNTSGNAGMAKGGSGDVLTGILTALLAQNYSPAAATLLGVYLHGLTADLAVRSLSEEALAARDLVNFLPQAFRELKNA